MSNSRIEQIIEEIEDYIDSCKGPLFGGGDKIVVDRERMEELLRELRMKTPEDFSFPSAHTMISVSAAAALFHYSKALGIPALVIAALVGFSRL